MEHYFFSSSMFNIELSVNSSLWNCSNSYVKWKRHWCQSCGSWWIHSCRLRLWMWNSYNFLKMFEYLMSTKSLNFHAKIKHNYNKNHQFWLSGSSHWCLCLCFGLHQIVIGNPGCDSIYAVFWTRGNIRCWCCLSTVAAL